MKIILLKDEKKLGKKGDIIEASDGYARNYILPKGVGVEATPANINDLKLLLAKDRGDQDSIFTRIKAAVKAGDWEKTSVYQLAMKNAMNELKSKYKTYCDNQI